MRKTKFMMRCAKHAFVLAAIFVVSLCTASCSKDDDNSGKEAQGNYIIIDGKKYDLTIGVWNYSNGNRNRGILSHCLQTTKCIQTSIRFW